MTPQELGKTITSIAVLKLSPSDIIVVRIPHEITDEDRKTITNHLDPYFPRNMIVVVDRGMDIKVANSKEDEGNCPKCGGEEFLTAKVGNLGGVFQNSNGTCARCWRDYMKENR